MSKGIIKISDERSGFNSGTTERSREIVKRVYHAEKRNNSFYKFTRCFLPMRGLYTREEDKAIHKRYYYGETVNIGDIMYIPSQQEQPFYHPKEDSTPNILTELNIVDAMLHIRWGDYAKSDDEYAEIRRNGIKQKSNVLKNYSKFYLSEIGKDKKIKPTSLMIEFLVGMVGVFISSAFFFYMLFSLSGMVTLMFCCTILIIASFAVFVLCD